MCVCVCVCACVNMHVHVCFCVHICVSQQCGTVEAEIKVLSVENPELKEKFSFKACSKSEYSHAYYTYCKGFFLR